MHVSTRRNEAGSNFNNSIIMDDPNLSIKAESPQFQEKRSLNTSTPPKAMRSKRESPNMNVRNITIKK